MQSSQPGKRNGGSSMMTVRDTLPQDWLHARETRCLVAGHAGAVELCINGVASPTAVAMVCHPHPLHGGSLDNKVVFTLARACRDNNIVAVRFNFRGVGRSAGTHDGGVGECHDALAVLALLLAGQPGLPVIFAGFSFGAAIAAQLAQTVPCAGLLLSAPPVPRYGLDGVGVIPVPVLLLQCDDDDVTDSAAVYHWFDAISAPEKVLARWPSGGHFFHGMLPDVKLVAERFLSALPV